jgi:hypothetical protein
LHHLEPDSTYDEYQVPQFLDLMITPHHPDNEDSAVALLYYPDGLDQPPMNLFFPLTHLLRPEFRDMDRLETACGIIHVGGDGHVDDVDLLPPEDRPLWRRIGMAELALRFHFYQPPTHQPEAGDEHFTPEWAMLLGRWAARRTHGQVWE